MLFAGSSYSLMSQYFGGGGAIGGVGSSALAAASPSDQYKAFMQNFWSSAGHHARSDGKTMYNLNNVQHCAQIKVCWVVWLWLLLNWCMRACARLCGID